MTAVPHKGHVVLLAMHNGKALLKHVVTEDEAEVHGEAVLLFNEVGWGYLDVGGRISWVQDGSGSMIF